MADCQTMMVRRKSGETLTSTGPNNGYGKGFTGTRSKSYHRHHTHGGHHHHSSSHHHHPHCHPQIHHQECHYYNGAGPNGNVQFFGGIPSGPLPPGQSCSFPPPNALPQFGGGIFHQQQQQQQASSPAPLPSHHNNTTTAQDPPPRPWIQLAHPKHKRTCFTVLCYNILCSRYATHTLYSYCPGWALDWNYRRKAILQELVHYAPDIISLQEMETDQFYNFFLPQLQLLGYSGIFGAKSRARNMVETKRKFVDGCAIFYRTNKFKLLSEHLIEFNQVAIANAAKKTDDGETGESWEYSEEMLNRVQTKDNIALAALLETKIEADDVSGLRGIVNPRPKPILVCTCHIHWDPNFCDVKLVQTMMLMKELRKISDNFDVRNEPMETNQPQVQVSEKRSGSSSSSASSSSLSFPNSPTNSIHTSCKGSKNKCKNALEKVNLLVCGDFNSLPQSGVVQFMENGKISNTHPDFKGLSYDGYIGTRSHSPTTDLPESSNVPLPPPTSEEFEHDFEVKSAYPLDSMPFTNYTLEFQGVIDYIFHSKDTLRPLGILGPFDTSWLVQHNIVGAPHPCIPSDHLPLLVELEMVPAI